MMKEMGKVAWSRKLKVAVAVLIVAVAVLLVLAVIPSAYCLGEGTPYIPTEEGVYYRVGVINETNMEDWGFKPEHFWTLTNPDSDILRAMGTPGVFVKTNLTSLGDSPSGTFLYEYYNYNCNPYFTYNGTYYRLYRGVMAIFYGGWKNAGGSGLICNVILLDQEPEDPENYVILTNPDPYTLAAIEHPGTLILFDIEYLRDHPNEQSLLDVDKFNCNMDKFKYKGKYYQCNHIFSVDAWQVPPRDWTKEITATGIGVSAVAVAAVAFTVYRKRKTNQK